MTAKQLLIGVDGGQTATKVVVTDASGRVLGTGEAPPIDHFRAEGGVARNRTVIHGGIHAALAEAGEPNDRVAAVALGLTGMLTGDPVSARAAAIVTDLLPQAAVTVVGDYETNLAGATGGEPGVVVIAGGGAIGFGVTGDGRQALASGYGYLLGDEGSAFWLGLAAINAASRADDGRGPATALLPIVLETLRIATMREAPPVVYREGFARDTISHLAPRVCAVAAGDEVAAALVERAGHELGLTALAVIRQLHDAGEPVAVAITGGVFNAGEVIEVPFTATLLAGWPAAIVQRPRLPPVLGGAIFASRLAGIEVDEAWLGNAGATLRTRADGTRPGGVSGE